MRPDPLLSPVARRHLRLLLRAVAPIAAGLERRFRVLLRERRYDSAHCRALVAITAIGATRVRTLPNFLEEVEYQGRRLAKLNLPLEDVTDLMAMFNELLDSALGGHFAPSREQLHLVVTQALQRAYYQVREAEAQVFFGLYEAQTEATGLDDLLERLVRILTRAFPARAGRLLLLDRAPAGKLARPLYIEAGAPEESLLAVPQRFASYWSIPVGTRALIQLGFETAYPWLPRERSLLQAVAARCCEAIERTRVTAEIRRLQAAAHHAEEQERRRIGRELHDEAAQSMLLLRLQLEMMERDASPELRIKLAESRLIVERTIDELRRIVAALSPAVLERLGLERALRHLGAKLNKLHPVETRLRISRGMNGLPRETQEVIYRVAQESLQNVCKHSHATQVKLSLTSADKNIRLSVQDNGAGFCTESALVQPLSFGLAGMKERAALLGGALEIRSAPGRGAAVLLTLPRESGSNEE